MLKIDLHLHSGEDPKDGLRYPATALIDRAVALRFAAIAITLHGRVLDDPRLSAYASERGLLLIPAVEWTIRKRDVLLYNLTQREAERLRCFEDLRAFKRERGEDLLVIAPHPCYPIGHSLRREFERNIDLFDAVEQTQLHLRWLNPNKPAVRIAARHGKPVVANSDAHALWMFGRHYTRVDAEPTMLSIFGAIREGRLERHCPPVSLWELLRFALVEPLLNRRPGATTESFAGSGPADEPAAATLSDRPGTTPDVSGRGRP
jgi:predicted metal-dependent phosphoesterase TrpH